MNNVFFFSPKVIYVLKRFNYEMINIKAVVLTKNLLKPISGRQVSYIFLKVLYTCVYI